MSRHETSSKSLELSEKEQLACSLRRQGYTLTEIAIEMGCAVSTAHKWIKQAIAKLPLHEATELKRTMMAQCNLVIRKAIKALEDAGPEPEMSTILMASKTISMQHVKISQLHGLDAPKENRNTNIDEVELKNMTDEQLFEVAQKLLDREHERRHEGLEEEGHD